MPNDQPSSLTSSHSNKTWWWVLILYGFSGVSCLAYEVLWSRMLALQFGVSIFGVVLTVAVFMIGLGIGSLAGVRWARRWNNPLAVFGWIEIAIAIYALLLPEMLQSLGGWIESIATHLTLMQWYLLQSIEAVCLLVVPASLMGIGFALVLKAVENIPLSLGKVYGLNTLGGTVGALFPLWSLSALGWGSSVRVIAVLGLLVGAAALLISRRAQPGRQADSGGLHRPPLTALSIYAGIGAGSLMLEIGWVRLYGMVMLRTEYVLGVILAVFLLGIALGSLVAPRLNKRLSILLPLIAGTGVLISLWLLPAASAWVERNQLQSFLGTLWSQALMLGIFTLPITLTLGAWLPILASRYSSAGAGGVWLYGANCLGGAIGAVVACVFFIPLLGSVGTVALAGLMITALGLSLDRARWTWLVFAVLLLMAWPLRNMPPVSELLPKIEVGSKNLSLYEDAISLTHVVQQQDGQRILLSDLQRMDASTEPSAVEIQMDQARLALLLHPAPHNVLFLGLGTGISMAGSRAFPDLDRTAVELSQGAILAAKEWFTPVNANIVALSNIQRDDARHYLNTTEKKFDVIVGDLFHPDIAGMGSLLSLQQFRRVRSHLDKDGIFVQWLALNQFDVQSLAVVLRSFRKAFPEAQMFMDGMHLALVGPESHFLGAPAMLANLQRLPVQSQKEATGGEGEWTWLGRYWGPIVETSGPIQDEWFPYVEYRLPRARYDGSVNLASMMMWMLQRHPAPDEAIKLLAIDEGDRREFGRAYVATELTARSWVSSIQGDESKAGNLMWMAYQANPQDRWIANALADSMLQSLAQARRHGLTEREALQRILKVYPNSVGALRALWRLEIAAGNEREAEDVRVRLLAISPLDMEAGRPH